MNNIAVFVTLIAYLAGLIGVGVWAQGRNAGEDDYFLGGRALGAFTAALSYAASGSSAWVLLGFSGYVYATGLSALWLIPGILAGYAVTWLWLGRRLRKEAAERRHVTLPDFLAADLTGAGRAIATGLAAALIAIGFTLYIAPQLQGAGAGFESQLGIDMRAAVALSAVIVIVYSWLGGFWAASVTDAIQGAIMLIIAIALPVAAVFAAGGPGGVSEALAASAPPAYLDWAGGQPLLLFIGFVLGSSGVGLAYLGQPQLLTRLMALNSDRSRRQGFYIAFGWAALTFAGMAVLGLAGRALFPELTDPETVFYETTRALFPAILSGVVLAAVLSAVMSTVDSLLIAAASAIAHDLGLTKWRPNADLLIARLTMTGICVVAAAITLIAPATIFGRVLLVWSALGAAFGPLVIARAAGARYPAWAAIAAMIGGFLLTVTFNVWIWTGAPGDFAERILPWLPGLVLLLAFGYRKARNGEPKNL